MEYKDTLLMPNTEFDMRAKLSEKEPKFRKEWREKNIYRKVLAENKKSGKGSFILHDGPPYANGNLHVGHALNKILKDIIVRRKNMEGFYSPFVPGWDTHGLPIENKMLQELNMKKDDLDKTQLRIEAEKYALKQIDNQLKQFEKMQLFTDFEDKYITLEKEYEVKQLELFKKMVLEGIIFKGLKPVYWSPSSQTALAEAEVEYAEHASPQVIVAFDIVKGNDLIKKDDKVLIMTTTPWTLIANAGVAVGKDIDYDIVNVNKSNYIVASELTNDVAEKSKWEDFKIVKTIKGKDIAGIKYSHPIDKEKTCPVVLGHHVSTEAGTGLVHIAPLFGEDDYIIGKKENLEMIMHVEDDGTVNEFAGEYKGEFYDNLNKPICIKLHEEGYLLHRKFIKHSYPHDWRTNKPIIYRGIPQWFVNINKIKKDILNELKKVESIPEWGKSRLTKMIEQREEWTISRQRTWGVPLIIFYDKDNNPIIDKKLFDHVIALVSKHGSNIWFEKSVEELLPKEYKNQGITKEEDIMDVWFDSGSSSFAVNIDGYKAPYDLYLEGSDQYRGWFNSSLINSVAYSGKAPYKKFISHGFVLDGKQQKMSKSKGNVVDPLKIIDTQGADILRMWASNTEYTSDVTISDEILKQNVEIYRRIRNTFKFMLGNLFDFDSAKDTVKLTGIHKYIDQVIENYNYDVKAHYDNYDFQSIVKDTNKLFIDLSGWYFNYSKDSLYCDKKDSTERRSVQTNIFKVLLSVINNLAPILPTTCEEAYKFIPNYKTKESLFLEKTVEPKKVKYDENIIFMLKSTRENVNIILEKSIKEGIAKRTNELHLVLDVPKDKRVGTELEYAKWLMVASVEFGEKLDVKTFESSKCKRCWNHHKTSELKDDICKRCKNVL